MVRKDWRNLNGLWDYAIRADDAALTGKKGALLRAVSAIDGKQLAEYRLDAPPTWDGMAAAGGRLYLSSTDGKVLCMGKGN